MKAFWADIFTLSGAGIFLIFGLSYLFKSISVKKHCSMIQKQIEELDIQIRTYLFALMRVVAGGIMALVFIIVCLQLQYSKQEHEQYPLIILISSSIFFLSALHAMILVKKRTAIKPHITYLVLGILFIIAGYVLNINAV